MSAWSRFKDAVKRYDDRMKEARKKSTVPKITYPIKPIESGPVSYKDVKPSTTSPVKSYKDVTPSGGSSSGGRSGGGRSGGGRSGGGSSQEQVTITPATREQVEAARETYEKAVAKLPQRSAVANMEQMKQIYERNRARVVPQNPYEAPERQERIKRDNERIVKDIKKVIGKVDKPDSSTNKIPKVDYPLPGKEVYNKIDRSELPEYGIFQPVVESGPFKKAVATMDKVLENRPIGGIRIGLAETGAIGSVTAKEVKEGTTEFLSKTGEALTGKENIWIDKPKIEESFQEETQKDFQEDFGESIERKVKKKGERYQEEFLKSDAFEDIEEGFQKQTQDLFEEKYGKDIRKGKIKFEDAKDKFLSSREYKKLQEKFNTTLQMNFDVKYKRKLEDYAGRLSERAGERYFKSDSFKEIQTKYEGIIDTARRDLPWGKKLALGTGYIGLSLAGKAREILVPTSTKELGKSAAIVGGGAFALGVASTIPASVMTGVEAGFTGYGAYQTFKPNATPEEVGSGALILAASGSALAYRGWKYINRPIVKTYKIKPARAAVKTNQRIGRSFIEKNYEGTFRKAIYRGSPKFKTQWQRTYTVPGRRSTVTTPLRKFFGEGPLYRGIPADKLATTKVSYFGVKTTTISPYKQAFKKLTSYGYTASQAKNVLRIVKPQIIDLSTTQQVIIGKQGVKGRATFYYKNRVIMNNPRLGIKTKGGKTIIEDVKFTRKVGLVNEQPVIRTQATITRTLKKVPKFWKDLGITESKTFSETYSRVYVSPTGTTKLKVFDQGGIKIYKNVKFNNLKTIVGKEYSGTVTPTMRGGKPTLEIRTSITGDIMRPGYTTLFKGSPVDLTLGGTAITSPSKIIKTPFSKTFSIKDSSIKFRGAEKATTTTEIIKETGGKETIVQKVVGTGQSIDVTNKEILTDTTVLQTPVVSATKLKFTPAPKVDLLGGSAMFAGLGSTQNLFSGVVLSGKYDQKIKLDTKLSPIQTQTPLQSSELDIGLVQKQTPGNVQIPVLKPILEPIVEPIVEPITIPPEPVRPTFQEPQIRSPYIPPLTQEPLMKKIKRIVKKPELFGVFVKKQGEDIKLGTFSTLTTAKQKLTSKLRTTLRASGFITREPLGKKPTKIKAKKLGLFGMEFRPSKVSEFLVVERKQRRLKKRGPETVEIIGFRKKSKKKSKKKKSKKKKGGTFFGFKNAMFKI